MLLTIGMIVKNEEKYLRDCLNAIKPILEQVPSELIICDTGSSDSTIEIAKEFTDKVFEIGWRDDFAWAREQNLKRARGKWYMYIDADEIFQDTAELIGFFNSGEYKEYGSATFEMKNFLNVEGTNAAMFSPMRLYRRDKDTRWYGKIHEHIKPVKYPQKKLTSLVLHYGYAYETVEQKLEKHERNIVPMLDYFNKNPDDARNILHIANQYIGIGQYEEGMKYLEISLNLFEKDSLDVFYHATYQHIVSQRLYKREFYETIQIVSDYFNTTAKIWANAYLLKFQESTALSLLKRYEEAAKAGEESFEYFEQNERGELDRYILSATTIQEVTKEIILTFMVNNFAKAGLFDKSFEWMEKIKDMNEGYGIIHLDVFDEFAKVAVKTKPDSLVKIYDYVSGKYSTHSEEYKNAVATIESHLTEYWQKTALAKAIIAAGYEDFGDGYIRLQHLRKLDFNSELAGEFPSPSVLEELEYFVSAGKRFPQHFVDLLIIGIKHRADLSAILNNLHLPDPANFLKPMLRRVESNFADKVIEYLNESNFILECKSTKNLQLMSEIVSILIEIEPSLSDRLEQKKGERELALFEACIRLKHKRLGMIYREGVYCDDNISDLPEQEGFTYCVGSAFECKDSGDVAGIARYLRLSLRISPNMKDIINSIADKLKEEELAPSVHDQLAKETGRLKSIIYTMINTGNMDMAEKMLDGYVQVNPTDPEIGKIREMMKAG